MQPEVLAGSGGLGHLLFAGSTCIAKVLDLYFGAGLRAGGKQSPGAGKGSDMQPVAAVAVSPVRALADLDVVVSIFRGDHLAGGILPQQGGVI